MATEFAKAMTIGIGTIAPAISIGFIVSRAMEAIGRNPESADKIFLADASRGGLPKRSLFTC